MPLRAQQKPKLRPLRIALPSNTIAATHFYVGKSLGIFESHGFDPQILVLEPRAALAALMTGDLDFLHRHRNYDSGSAAQRAGADYHGRLEPARSRAGRIQGNHQHRAIARQSIGGLYGAGDGQYGADRLLRKRGLKPDEYKILNVGTARLPALVSGNVPAAVLNGLETAKAIKQGFRPLARAADEIELATGGLGTSIASIQSKRDVFRAVIQATLESIRVSATQKEKAVPVLMKQFAITQEDANLILDIVQKAWALDGRPTPGSQKFEFELAQRDMGLKDPPKPEQVYDFSILDEVVRR
jgi:ABC-type nitrate/sulfonate/bicarbonate transport system substrate-binding protein